MSSEKIEPHGIVDKNGDYLAFDGQFAIFKNRERAEEVLRGVKIRRKLRVVRVALLKLETKPR